MHRVSRLIVLSLALIAAATPAFAESMAIRYPTFANEPQKIQKVALIVDTFYLTDIQGKIHGIYKEDTEILTPILADVVKHRVENLGFEVPFMHTNSGLFASPNTKAVYADHKKSTGVDVTFPIYDSNPPSWAGGEAIRNFMDTTINKMRTHTSEKGIASVDVPESLQALPVDAVIIVSVISHNVGMEKTLGIALATGLVTGGLSGGGFYSVYSVRSAATVLVTVVDTRSGEVLWYQSISRPGRGAVGGTAQSFPVLRHALGRVPSRARKLRVLAAAKMAETASAESSAPVTDTTTEAAEHQSDDQAAVITDGGGESDAESADAEESMDTRTMVSLPENPKDWKPRDAKLAHSLRQITTMQYQNYVRQRKVDYRNSLKAVEAEVKAKTKDKRTGEIETLKLRWEYIGL